MRLGYVVPLVLFIGLAFSSYVGLGLKPRDIPSAMIDKPVPEFTLPAVMNHPLGLKSADLRAGEVSLVNVFASWCGPCRIEHPKLTELAANGAKHGAKHLRRNILEALRAGYERAYQPAGPSLGPV